MAEPIPQTLPVLSGVSLVVVGLSFAGASALHLWRHRNARDTGRGQFFNDGGAIISLIVLACMIIDMIRPVPEIAELVKDNVIIAFWAVGYAGVMVALNLYDSAQGGRTAAAQTQAAAPQTAAPAPVVLAPTGAAPATSAPTKGQSGSPTTAKPRPAKPQAAPPKAPSKPAATKRGSRKPRPPKA